MEQITPADYNLEDEFFLHNIIGKNVLSNEGDIVGKVKDVVIEKFQVKGIVVKKWLKPPVYIDKAYFDSWREDAVILSIMPVTSLVGLPVLDMNGRKLGKIIKIVRDKPKNEFTSFHVKKGYSHERIFKAADIDKISENVILNKEIEK